MKSIAIIGNVWNHYQTTKQCLIEMIETSGVEAYVVIHDQGSSDGTDRLVSKMFEDGQIDVLVRSEKNIGNPQGLNKILKYAKGEYIAKIDPDFNMPKNWLKTAAEILDENSDVGIVGFYWARGLTHVDLKKGVPRKSGNHIIFDADKVFGVWVFRRELIDKIGPFNQDHSYGNWDSIFNEKVKELGYKVVYAKNDANHLGKDTDAERRLKNYLRKKATYDTRNYFDADEFKQYSNSVNGQKVSELCDKPNEQS